MTPPANETLYIYPGLCAGPDGLLWTDSLGRVHDLSRAERLTIADVAIRLKRTARCVRGKIAAKELYPVVGHNAHDIEVFACGLDDYIIRKVRGVVVRRSAAPVGLSGNAVGGVVAADGER